MRIHYLQHVPFEGLGFIETWAKTEQHNVTSTKFYNNETVPDINHFDILIIMGGPMGLNDKNPEHWLQEERTFIKNAIEANKIVIGICLGAQLIAQILGAKIYANKHKEIGWFPVEKIKKHEILNGIPDQFQALHWHGDMFDIPKKATHLMKSEGCKNQSFIYNEKVVGLQFHLESTPETLKSMLTHCKQDLECIGSYIQTEKEIMDKKGLCKQTNGYITTLLHNLVWFNS